MAFEEIGVRAVVKGFGPYMSQIGQMQSKTGKFGSTLGTGLKVAGLAAAAGIGFSIKAYADFDAAMTQSLAIMGDVDEKLEKDMVNAARKMAKQTTFSAKDAAESYFYLASAGLDAKASVAALPTVAQFAQAGMFDMALATDLLTDAQSALGLTIRDDAVANMENMIRVSDVLVKANTLANATVQQFSESLTNRAGAALRMVNKDVEEGVAVLAAFADQGIKGAEAGTRLDIVLRDLQSKAVLNKDVFAELGVSVFDAEGNMRNIADVIADLEHLLGPMNDEMKRATLLQLGFSDRSVASILALMGMSDQIKVYESELRKAGGTTETVAKKQLETFNAQLNLLMSHLTDLAIEVGSKIVPQLVKFMKTIQQKVIPALEEWWKKHGPKIETVLKAYLRYLKEVWGFLATFFMPALDTLADLWDNLWPILEQHVIPVLKRLGEFLKDHKPLLLGIAVAILAITNPWLAVAAAIAVVLAKWDEISCFFSVDVPKAIDKFLDKIGEIPIIGEIFKGTFKAIKTIVITTFKLIYNRVETAINAIRDIIKIVTALIHGDWEEAWNGVKDLVSGIWGGIKEEIELTLGLIKDLIGIYLDTFLGVIKDGWGLVKDFFTHDIPDWLKNNWKDILIAVFAGIPILLMYKFRDKLSEAVTEVAGNLLQAGQETIGHIWEGLKGLPGFAATLMADFHTMLAMAIVGLAGDLIKAGASVTAWIWEGLKGIWQMGWDMIAELADGAWQGIMDKAGDFAEMGRNVIDKLSFGLFGSPHYATYEIGQDLVADLAQGMENKLPDIERYTQKWLIAISTIFSTGGIGAAVSYANELIAELRTRGYPGIAGEFAWMMGKLVEYSNQQGAEAGGGLVGELIDKVEREERATGIRVSNSLRAAFASFSGEAREWGVGIAGYVMAGIYHGFRDEFPAYAVEIANIIYEELKKALGASSPARKMIKLGQSIREGLQIGLDWPASLMQAMMNFQPATLAAPTISANQVRDYVLQPRVMPAPTAPASTGGDFNATISVMSEREIAQEVSRTLRGLAFGLGRS